MKLLLLSACALCIGVTAAQAQTFSDVRDAAAGKFFDAATSTADGAQLTIGLNTGYNPATFVSNEFRASNLAYQNRMAADTISFVVTAPDGFYIAGLTYTQQGTSSTNRTAVQRGTTQWTVNGFPAVIGEYTNPTVSGAVDLSALQASSVAVSITSALFVGPAGDIAITSANVSVDIRPLAGVRTRTGPEVQADGSVVSILD